MSQRSALRDVDSDDPAEPTPMTPKTPPHSLRTTGSAVLRFPGRVVVRLLLLLLWLYQNLVSPMRGPTCRYYPSCSSYAVGALRRHGAAKGTALAVARVCRCHPWAAGGLDPVPPVGRWRSPPEPAIADPFDPSSGPVAPEPALPDPEPAS